MLTGPVKGKYFDCYTIADISSGFIVGAHIHAAESGGARLGDEGIFGIQGIPMACNRHNCVTRRYPA